MRRRSRVGAYCSCLQGGARPRLVSRAARTRKKALSSILTERHKRKWALVPLQANAQLQLPVSAFLAALFLQTWPVGCLMLPPCCGHASCSPWLRARPPVTSRPWQPRPSNGAYEEAAEGMRGLPLSRTTLKARYDSGELVRASPPADAKRQRVVDDSTSRRPAPAETARFLRMLKTREQIRLAKAAGAPWPWSDDDVLNRHKFTNVKREHDRTTAWLRTNWTAAHANADAATVLFNCGVFRVFGTVAFAEQTGWTADLSTWNAFLERCNAVACWEAGTHAFTSAYNRIRFNAERRKGDAGPPVDVYDKELSTLEGLRLAVNDIVAVPAGGRLSWRAVCTRLRGVNGFGGSGFMAKEVLLDAMGWPSMRRLVRDEGDWTPPGPGARRGLNRLHGRALNLDSPGEARFITEMRLLLRTLRSLDPEFCKSIGLDLHDVQFQLCEYDKYCRVGDGGHVHPYRPHVSLNIPDLPARPHPHHALLRVI